MAGPVNTIKHLNMFIFQNGIFTFNKCVFYELYRIQYSNCREKNHQFELGHENWLTSILSMFVYSTCGCPHSRFLKPTYLSLKIPKTSKWVQGSNNKVAKLRDLNRRLPILRLYFDITSWSWPWPVLYIQTHVQNEYLGI